MVNDAETPEPDRALALARVPAGARPGLLALFALDGRLAAIVRTTREPMVGQMRLTWWHGALERLDAAPPPAEPVLAALAHHVLPRGIAGAALAEQVDGWEALLDGTDDGAMERFAAARGGALFTAGATMLGAAAAPVARGGEAWALADLARHLRDPAAAARARGLADARLADAFRPRWPRAVRPLGLMAIAATLDLGGVAGIARARRLLGHAATGG